MIENHQNGVRKYSHRDLRNIFSLDRQVVLKDVCVDYLYEKEFRNSSMVADSSM